MANLHMSGWVLIRVLCWHGLYISIDFVIPAFHTAHTLLLLKEECSVHFKLCAHRLYGVSSYREFLLPALR